MFREIRTHEKNLEPTNKKTQDGWVNIRPATKMQREEMEAILNEIFEQARREALANLNNTNKGE